jgi:hypothetical protein
MGDDGGRTAGDEVAVGGGWGWQRAGDNGHEGEEDREVQAEG